MLGVRGCLGDEGEFTGGGVGKGAGGAVGALDRMQPAVLIVAEGGDTAGPVGDLGKAAVGIVIAGRFAQYTLCATTMECAQFFGRYYREGPGISARKQTLEVLDVILTYG